MDSEGWPISAKDRKQICRRSSDLRKTWSGKKIPSKTCTEICKDDRSTWTYSWTLTLQVINTTPIEPNWKHNSTKCSIPVKMSVFDSSSAKKPKSEQGLSNSGSLTVTGDIFLPVGTSKFRYPKLWFDQVTFIWSELFIGAFWSIRILFLPIKTICQWKTRCCINCSSQGAVASCDLFSKKGGAWPSISFAIFIINSLGERGGIPSYLPLTRRVRTDVRAVTS